MKMNPAAKFSLSLVLSLVTMLLAGCASTPPVNWNSRVGHFDYNEAMRELGAPNRQTRLSDGQMQYGWYTQPRPNSNLNTGMSYYGSSGFTAGQDPGGGYHNQMLQLTFDTNGVLSAWSKTDY